MQNPMLTQLLFWSKGESLLCYLQGSQKLRADDQLLLNMMASTAITHNGHDAAQSLDGSVGVRPFIPLLLSSSCLTLVLLQSRAMHRVMKQIPGMQVKKTRRGKRAGRNLKDRPSFEGRRISTDSRRISVEGRPSFEMPLGPIDGRASTDSQRPSFDLQV